MTLKAASPRRVLAWQSHSLATAQGVPESRLINRHPLATYLRYKEILKGELARFKGSFSHLIMQFGHDGFASWS